MQNKIWDSSLLWNWILEFERSWQISNFTLAFSCLSSKLVSSYFSQHDMLWITAQLMFQNMFCMHPLCHKIPPAENRLNITPLLECFQNEYQNTSCWYLGVENSHRPRNDNLNTSKARCCITGNLCFIIHHVSMANISLAWPAATSKSSQKLCKWIREGFPPKANQKLASDEIEWRIKFTTHRVN